jgi:hypothetical protein
LATCHARNISASSSSEDAPVVADCVFANALDVAEAQILVPSGAAILRPVSRVSIALSVAAMAAVEEDELHAASLM